MANCTLNTIEYRVDELYNTFVGFIKKADCWQTTIAEAAGKENLKDMNDEIGDILTVLLSIPNQNNLYNRIIVLARSVEQAMEECTF